MELKFADEENKSNHAGGLRFSDDNREENGLKLVRDENPSENGVKFTDGNQADNGMRFVGGGNQTESGLNLVGEEIRQSGEDKMEKNPWDMEEPVVVSTISTTAGSSGYSKSQKDGNNMVLMITQIIMYVLMGLTIASIAWMSTQPLVNLYVNLLKFQWMYSLLSLAIIVDVILVSVLWGRKISLILVAIFFGFWYPKKRNEYVNGHSGMASILGIAYVIATIVLCGLAFKATVRYGAVIQKDEVTRTEVSTVLDQITESGATMGDVISDNIVVTDAYVEEQNGKSVVILCGAGNIDINDDVLMLGTEKNVVTQMAFVKDSATGEYKLAAVALNEKTLSQYGATAYWNQVKEN